MSTRTTLDFLKTETGSGLLLVAAAGAAVVLANSPFAHGYYGFIGQPFTLRVGAFEETMSVLRWVERGLMAVFFFVLGLEIKYEVLRGELSNPRRLALPILAAVGGVAGPAAVYLVINAGAGGAPQGWPTAVGTDIAVALAALALVGRRLPASLRVFLLTLAVADDVIAVGLIAILFTDHLHPWMLAGAFASLSVLAAMSRWRTAPRFFYAVAFALLWAFTVKSGVNTALAGAAAAFTIPIEPKRPGEPSLLREFMESLHPYVAFLILPLFAFTAAGFSLAPLPLHLLASPVTLGVALGLFLGKQIGVFGAAALVIGLKLARRPTGARWIELYGVSLLCGAGFTLSLFLGGLALEGGGSALQSSMRLGVVAGSLLSALCGMGVLAWSGARRAAEAA